MYFFLGAALIAISIAWYMAMKTIFFFGSAAAVAILTYIHTQDLNKDLFLKQSIHCMAKTDCCCIHKIWSNPNNIIWTTTTLRILAGLAAIAAIYISWEYSEEFTHGKYFLIPAVWSLVIGIWLFSCVPFIIALIQCAAEKGTTKPMSIDIQGQVLDSEQIIKIENKSVTLASGETIIIRFRKLITMWVIHDIVIGVFWMYLTLMLYDLTDDSDDSNWRTIFLSMISWHIVCAALYHIYLKDQWSSVQVELDTQQSRACCAPSEADKWWTFLQLAGLAAGYIAAIWRVNGTELVEMECEIETLALLIGGIFAWVLGKRMVINVLHGTKASEQVQWKKETIKYHDDLNIHF